MAQAQAAGIRLLTWEEPEYPQRPREIDDPPLLLYVRGNIELLDRHQISIVGSRRPTPYGNQMPERLARDLADGGLVIVSGLARGVDSSAHRGALSSAAGATIGVLGCGIDVIYPEGNKRIFAEMETRGAIISEFTMGTFQPAELSDSQSRHRGNLSGSRSRGRRTIFRRADQTGRQAGHRLGRCDRRAADFHPCRAIARRTATSEQRALLVEESLAPAELTLYNLVTHDESRHVDEPAERCGLTSSEVLAALFDLELKGVVGQLPGKQFLKVLL